MQKLAAGLLFSPSDLVTFLGCRHATALDFRALSEKLERTEDDATLELLQRKGIEHEQTHLKALQESGRAVAIIPDGAELPERTGLTLDAMRRGVDVVYQAALMDGAWHGFADFLVRVDAPSRLGAWSYEAADTKLSSRVSPRYAVQLSVYSWLLAMAQGVQPANMSVVLGNGRTEMLRVDDFRHYTAMAARRLEAFVGGKAMPATTPEPCSHCAMCHWKDRCENEWTQADHLSRVANIRRSQADKLRAAGVTTVSALARLADGAKIQGIGEEPLQKLRDQAALQVSVHGTDDTRHKLLPPIAGRGFARLPRPSSGDLFFDMEGDPLYPEGLEYLFGVLVGGRPKNPIRQFWGHDRDQERKAFEAFVDFVVDHLSQHPAAHVYHYGHYEVMAIRDLAMAHGTREAAVDDLLRREKFVDLFKIVREGLLVSEPSYSLKNLEKFYGQKREGDVSTAGDSIVAYENWRVTHDDRILDEIAEYNGIDCRSTEGLRDWLVSIRPSGTAWFDPAAVAPDPKAIERQQQADVERAAIEAKLLSGADEADLPLRSLVVDLVEFHRREQKPDWWAMFDRQERDEDELVDDGECLGALRLVGPPTPDKRSLLHTYRFPIQETKLAEGDRPVVAHTGEPAGSIEELDLRKGVVTLKRGAAKGPLPAVLSLGPSNPVRDAVLRQAIRRFADDVAAGTNRFPAIQRFLRREAPRFLTIETGRQIVAAGTEPIAGSMAAVSDLDGSHLFVQGPPGTGKTYTAAHVIVELLRRGKRIGVSSNSHKAINKILTDIEDAAKSSGDRFVGYKKATQGNPETEFSGNLIRNAYANDEIPADAGLLAGTAWLFADERFELCRDYLFIDEAGQVSLANVVAMGTSAKNVVLVGDQMQLGQPIQGSHPGKSGMSSLEFLLDGTSTVPPDRGIFLDVSRRMHPDLCGWVSEVIYDKRLTWHPSTERQELLLRPGGNPALSAHGLRFVSVEHNGRSQRSPEEADAVKALWTELIGQKWRDREGKERTITPNDVLVVAPYNMQVNCIRELLPDDARIGTVDKFQGQEGAAVLLSMTTSSGDDLLRGVDFLFSRNRLNVAISRAHCLAVVISSPRLLEVTCNDVEDLRLVNILCAAHEWMQ